MKAIVIWIFGFSFLLSQPQKDIFISSNIQSGLPPEIPFKWSNTLYAKINSSKFYEALYIVSKDSFRMQDGSFIFMIRKNGFRYSPVSFSTNEAVINLTSDSEDLLAPLKIRVDLDKSTIRYRWESNNSYSANPYVIKEYGLKVGKVFPTIKIETQSGNWTNSNKNKIIVLNWWATTCTPCVAEIPGLNKLTEKYSDKDIEFIAIVWDKENHSKFIKDHPFVFEQCFGDTTICSLLGDAFPRNLIIDKNGAIVYNKVGGSKDTYIELDRVIEKLL